MNYVDPLVHCPFTKHPGKLWRDVLEEDRLYVEWLVSGNDGPTTPIDDELYDHLIGLLEDE